MDQIAKATADPNMPEGVKMGIIMTIVGQNLLNLGMMVGSSLYAHGKSIADAHGPKKAGEIVHPRIEAELQTKFHEAIGPNGKDVPVFRDKDGTQVKGSGVEIRYELDGYGLPTDIKVIAGPTAAAGELGVHADAVRVLLKYQGFSGYTRGLLDRFFALLRGKKPAELAPTGSRAHNAAIELSRLPAEIDRIHKALAKDPPGIPPKDAELYLAHLEQQLRAHEQALTEFEQGDSFVAAQAPTTAEAMKHGYPAPPKDHFYTLQPDGSYQLSRHVTSTEPPQMIVVKDGKPTLAPDPGWNAKVDTPLTPDGKGTAVPAAPSQTGPDMARVRAELVAALNVPPENVVLVVDPAADHVSVRPHADGTYEIHFKEGTPLSTILEAVESATGAPSGHVGGVRGTTVYELTGKLGPTSLEKGIKPLLGNSLAAGATLAAAPTPAGAPPGLRYKVTVPQAGGATATVEVVVHATDKLPSSAAHGDKAGPARFGLERPAKPGDPWTAEVLIDPRVKDRDVRFVVGHELDEIALIVADDTPEHGIAAQTESRLYRPDGQPGDTTITKHDLATARELVALIKDVENVMNAGGQAGITDAAIKRIQDPNAPKPELKAKLDRLDNLMEEMGLYKSERRAEKLATIQAAGQATPQVMKVLEEFVTVRSAFREYHGGKTPKAGSLITEGLVQHLLYPDTKGGFVSTGIAGGHDDALLHAFIKANPEYQLKLLKTKGDFAVYEQTLTKNGQTVTSKRPKSTVKDVQSFMAEADATILAYFAANPLTKSEPNWVFGAANNGPTIVTKSGVELGGYVDYNHNTGQYTLRSVYPDATWVLK